MSDGQAYLLLLLTFYLLEGCVIAPFGSHLVRSPTGHRFTPRSALIPLGGIRKSLFLKSVLPAFPASLILPHPNTPDLKTPSPASVARLRRLTIKSTTNLRVYSCLIFFIFFLILPFAYLYRGDDPLTTSLVIFGYGLMLINGIQYFLLHRRFLPSKALWSESLFCAFLPWHSMRAADHLLTTPSRQTHPLSTLLSLPPSPKTNSLLAQLWQDCQNDKETIIFSHWLANRNLDPDTSIQIPEADSPDAAKYCPRCSQTFIETVTHCSDCSNSTLVTLKNVK